MFKIEKNNDKIGKYLDNIIKQKYKSRREFCRAYIQLAGEEPTNEISVTNMSNRLMQISNGNKAIQTYDLPYFCELLEVSCEQILSAGDFSGPRMNRVTNYSIAYSKNPNEWEKYINHPNNLISNCDEYNKTVLDYALEFGNYEFLKYLMDKEYITFDSGNNRDYKATFGAKTSIKRRDIGSIDYGLEGELSTNDQLRINLIPLACDNNDLDMLNKLRAREIPQLYFNANYHSGQHPDFDSCYNERMVKHIAESNEFILDYFTDSFEIKDFIKYKDGIERKHTFLFPHISKLLDQLITINSPFAETALKKALNYNHKTYEKLCESILASKNSEQYSADDMKERWLTDCEEDLEFFDNGNIIMFKAFYVNLTSQKRIDGIITNVPHVTQKPISPALKHLAEELNVSYLKIKNIKEHLGDF